MKLGVKVLEAVSNLRANPDFAAFMHAVSDHTSTSNERLIKAPQGDEFLRGQVYAFSTLLEEVNTAPEKLKKALAPKT